MSNVQHGRDDSIPHSHETQLTDRAERRREKARRVSLSRALKSLRRGKWTPCDGWDDETFLRNSAVVVNANCFRSKSLPLALMVVSLLSERQPDTVRGVMYAVVSAGGLPDTSDKSYGKVQRILNELRKRRVIPYQWVVDNIRATEKPSSWTGLTDFAETVQRAYRKDYWRSLPDYVCFIVEKDTVAGRIVGVTRQYDVALHPLRGFNSTSFNFAIADQWREIQKPITAYYIGDFDPAGMAIEEDVKAKLIEYSGRTDVCWKRLGVCSEHFDEFDIIPLAVKRSDTRYKRFVDQHGDRGAEVEAIPADALRQMVEDAIKRHIPSDEWARLSAIEEQERESWKTVMSKLSEVA